MTKKYTEAELRAVAAALPHNDDEWTEEDLKNGRVKFIGVGHASAIEHERNLGGRPKSADKKILISIRLRESTVQKLKGLGKGWQTAAGKYLMDGVNSGKIAGIEK
ncbi:MAG: BrnA antitoxin family protein [Chitinispirillales bacterium]|jgi:uncharacterized protein (DUF4415 family)|nr:BrnA antitoxin family protein [Chitinispirillales bacterium]